MIEGLIKIQTWRFCLLIGAIFIPIWFIVGSFICLSWKSEKTSLSIGDIHVMIEQLKDSEEALQKYNLTLVSAKQNLLKNIDETLRLWGTESSEFIFRMESKNRYKINHKEKDALLKLKNDVSSIDLISDEEIKQIKAKLDNIEKNIH